RCAAAERKQKRRSKKSQPQPLHETIHHGATSVFRSEFSGSACSACDSEASASSASSTGGWACSEPGLGVEADSSCAGASGCDALVGRLFAAAERGSRVILNSTRRFINQAHSVSLSIRGCSEPKPRKLSLLASKPPSSIRKFMTL